MKQTQTVVDSGLVFGKLAFRVTAILTIISISLSWLMEIFFSGYYNKNTLFDILKILYQILFPVYPIILYFSFLSLARHKSVSGMAFERGLIQFTGVYYFLIIVLLAVLDYFSQATDIWILVLFTILGYFVTLLLGCKLIWLIFKPVLFPQTNKAV